MCFVDYLIGFIDEPTEAFNSKRCIVGGDVQARDRLAINRMQNTGCLSWLQKINHLLCSRYGHRTSRDTRNQAQKVDLKEDTVRALSLGLLL